MNPQKAKKIQENETVAILTEALTRGRNLVTNSCFDCFDILVKAGKFNIIEVKIAVGLAADALVNKLLPEFIERHKAY